VKDFHTLVEQFEEAGAHVMSVTQGLDTSTPVSRLLRNILMDFAEFEREMISERTKDKMLARAQRGLWNGGIAPYGYTCHDKRLVLYPEEAVIIKQMFDLYATSRSLAHVVDMINLQSRTRQGRPRANSTIETILRNPIYAGKIAFNGHLYDGIHEAIIPYDLFRVLGTIKKVRTHTHTAVDRVFLLKGLLVCPHCGAALTLFWVQKKNGRKIFYYRCISTTLYKINPAAPSGSLMPRRLSGWGRSGSLRWLTSKDFWKG